MYSLLINIAHYRKKNIGFQNHFKDVIFIKKTSERLKYTVFLDVTTYGSYKYRCFGGMYRLHQQGDKNWQAVNNVSIFISAANYC
jgi:hypothetical protein